MHEKSQVKTHRCLGRADAHNMSAFQERNPTISATRSGLTGVYPTGSLRKCLRSVKWAEISIWSYFGLFWPVTDLSEVGHVGVRCGDLVLRFLIRRIALWSDTDVEAKPFVTRNPQRETLPKIAIWAHSEVFVKNNMGFGAVISANRHIQIVSNPDHSDLGLWLSGWT